jgi:hypothetical protein
MRRPSPPAGSDADRTIGHPTFAQPAPTADPTEFEVKHASDTAAYAAIDKLNAAHKLNPMPFPAPRGGAEPVLTLQAVLGNNAAAIAAIEAAGQIVFHAGGDCGSTIGPKSQNAVTDKMVSDFVGEAPGASPQFNFLLGDVVYSFGELQYYYDQFYEPYRSYPAPILAVAGNHDGMVSPLAHAKSLDGFLRNFCAQGFVVRSEAGGLTRTAQIQPGVFYTLEAPFVRILALYSNTLEDPGYISGTGIGSSQITFLRAALNRVKAEKFSGALVIAHHHPPYTAGASRHGWSIQMQAEIDQECAAAGVWPHAVLSGHAHNYQRFTRTRADGTQIPYVVCGNMGHGLQQLSPRGGPVLRAPQVLQPATKTADQIVFERYDDGDYGYLRVIVSQAQLRIEYHPSADGSQAKTPDDSVTVDLATRKLTQYVAKDLGHPAAVRQTAKLAAAHPATWTAAPAAGTRKKKKTKR